jgi:uncharacterized membrane protein YbjE (DUF340 family)
MTIIDSLVFLSQFYKWVYKLQFYWYYYCILIIILTYYYIRNIFSLEKIIKKQIKTKLHEYTSKWDSILNKKYNNYDKKKF